MSILARQTTRKAILVLADGTVFHGTAIGAPGKAVGEVVFNTAMTGYQEILTDPSYTEQIVTLTYPHIGNTGVNAEDVESDKVWAKALVIRDLSLLASNFRSEHTLSEYLVSNNVVGIADIDTRRLTNIIREKGAQGGCIVTLEAGETPDVEAAHQAALGFAGLTGRDLAKVVSCASPYEWKQTSWQLGSGYGTQEVTDCHVVVYDFGVKFNMLRMLADRGCRVTVVPAQTTAEQVMAMQPDGVLLSNGPGDPAACDYAITAVQQLLEQNVPLFGICLGYQILALAMGAKTVKMSHGHHGGNHPVLDIAKGVVMITGQNHGFAVEEATLPSSLKVTHKSLFDQTLQGIRAVEQPAFGFQGHPEASAGPHDAAALFNQFFELMQAHKVTH